MTTWQCWEVPPAVCGTKGQTDRTRKKWPTKLDHSQTISSATCNSYTMRATAYAIDNETRRSHCHSAVCQHYLSTVPTAAHRKCQMIFLPEAIPLPFITAHLNTTLPSVRMLHFSPLPTLPLYYVAKCPNVALVSLTHTASILRCQVSEFCTILTYPHCLYITLPSVECCTILTYPHCLYITLPSVRMLHYSHLPT